MIKGVSGLGRMLAAVLVVGASAIVALAAPASAAVPNSWGFGFLDNPAPVPPYPLPAATEASSSGLGAAVTAHPAVGSYTIEFKGIGTPQGSGVVHVTAAPVKPAPVWCQALQWFPAGGNEFIDVVCYQTNGAMTMPVNTDFSVVFTWSTRPAPAGVRYGYLESTGTSGTVTQFDSAPGAITSTLVAPGVWHVVMPGLGGAGPQAGGIQVTTATAQHAHCKVRNWATRPSRQDITVICFSPAGAPADVRWNLTYQDARDITGRATGDFGYIWHTAAPPAATNFNSACGPVNTVMASPPGYKLTFPCIDAPPDNVLVTPSGPDNDFCNISGLPAWSAAGPAVIVPSVDCYHVNGMPSAADDFFTTYTSG